MSMGGIALPRLPYLIAEAGINHNGDIAVAHRMIGAAAKSGVDAIKFQTYHTDEFCPRSSPLYETFKQCELPDEAWVELAHHAKGAGLAFMSTPQNLRDLELLLPLEMPAIKVGSDDFTNHTLLKNFAAHGLPLILSTGM